MGKFKGRKGREVCELWVHMSGSRKNVFDPLFFPAKNKL